ncbi:hypothetical protein R6Q59_018067 [Mikania micrantha]
MPVNSSSHVYRPIARTGVVLASQIEVPTPSSTPSQPPLTDPPTSLSLSLPGVDNEASPANATPILLMPTSLDHADQPPPPPPAHHVVVRQPRLHPADATILRDLVGSVRDLSGRVDRLEGMMRWMTERMAASAGMDIPVFPGPGHHQDPQDPGGHA